MSVNSSTGVINIDGLGEVSFSLAGSSTEETMDIELSEHSIIRCSPATVAEAIASKHFEKCKAHASKRQVEGLFRQFQFLPTITEREITDIYNKEIGSKAGDADEAPELERIAKEVAELTLQDPIAQTLPFEAISPDVDEEPELQKITKEVTELNLQDSIAPTVPLEAASPLLCAEKIKEYITSYFGEIREGSIKFQPIQNITAKTIEALTQFYKEENKEKECEVHEEDARSKKLLLAAAIMKDTCGDDCAVFTKQRKTYYDKLVWAPSMKKVLHVIKMNFISFRVARIKLSPKQKFAGFKQQFLVQGFREYQLVKNCFVEKAI